MLLAEWNMEDALAFRFDEGKEEGREEGRDQNSKDIAQKALAKGVPIELVQQITGLDLEIIKNLAKK